MLRAIQKLGGYTVHAVDGEVGKVADFYFDDNRWTIRYLVVEMNSHDKSRRVLLSPVAIKTIEDGRKVLALDLPAEKIRLSPDVDTDRPVSRQHEAALHDYYQWPYYWGLGMNPAVGALPPIPPVPVQPEEEVQVQPEDPHLRSLKEVLGYDIQARDGKIGEIKDWIVEDENWSIAYMVVDTGGWLGGRQVLVSPSWVERVSWAETEITVDLKRETVENSPEYDPNVPLDRATAERLNRHDGERRR